LADSGWTLANHCVSRTAWADFTRFFRVNSRRMADSRSPSISSREVLTVSTARTGTNARKAPFGSCATNASKDRRVSAGSSRAFPPEKGRVRRRVSTEGGERCLSVSRKCPWRTCFSSSAEKNSRASSDADDPRRQTSGIARGVRTDSPVASSRRAHQNWKGMWIDIPRSSLRAAGSGPALPAGGPPPYTFDSPVSRAGGTSRAPPGAPFARLPAAVFVYTRGRFPRGAGAPGFPEG
jgi:hypothetical protein